MIWKNTYVFKISQVQICTRTSLKNKKTPVFTLQTRSRPFVVNLKMLSEIFMFVLNFLDLWPSSFSLFNSNRKSNVKHVALSSFLIWLWIASISTEQDLSPIFLTILISGYEIGNRSREVVLFVSKFGKYSELSNCGTIWNYRAT